MTIAKISVKPHQPSRYMNDDIILGLESHTHVGLIFHEDGLLHFHVNKFTSYIFKFYWTFIRI